MNKNIKTVVIPAAGFGNRLSSFTKNYSKAMCTLGEKPLISYIIEKFSDDDNIVILLGYKGDLLKQVINACYPNKNITYVNVDKYEGEGSGLGYSLYCAAREDLLQCPFIFWSCDTILEDLDINKFDYHDNWMIAAETSSEYFNEYRHVKVNNDNYVTEILPKDVNYNDNIYSYTGVSFIKDYKKFWESYIINKDAFIKEGECYGLCNLNSIRVYNVDKWIDGGNKKILEYWKSIYNKNMEATVLEKPDECIWFIDNRVIKFHINKDFIYDRVHRFDLLKNVYKKNNNIIIPKLLSSSDNVYVYEMAKGKIASKQINTIMFEDILNKCLNDVDILKLSDEEKLNIYNDFYLNKTLSRIQRYCAEYSDIDNDDIYINGIKCQSATTLVNNIDWEKISKNAKFSHAFHGDFHLENILVNKNDYVMLDFRQNFGKKLYYGDIYYDIAKMWHSLIVNHEMVKNNLFIVNAIDKNHINIDIHRTFIDTECEKVLLNWLQESETYDLTQSELLTCIIFLNIAACHVYPYSKFLFNLGKLMINNFYNKHNEYFV